MEKVLCPWCAQSCDCAEFPWTQDELIPEKCQTLVRERIPALVSWHVANKRMRANGTSFS
jgi:hypothetical protein